MANKPFSASQFQATKFDTALDKAKFANQFVSFIESDFSGSPAKFPKWFYKQLSMTFGHIAHYNQQGFYEEFFTNSEDKLRFVKFCLQGGGYGDPQWTYSDVEKALKAWLLQNDILGKCAAKRNQDVETRERAMLAKLKEKYDG